MPYKDEYEQYLYWLKYQIENKERIKKQRAEHYQATKEEQMIINKKYYLAHLEQIRKRNGEYRKIHREKLNADAKEYYSTHRDEQKENNKKYYRTHQKEVINYRSRSREQRKIYRQEHWYKLKLQAYLILGNKCSNPNCAVPGGMTDIRALQVDHINGGGSKEIRNYGHDYIYRKIIDGKNGYQLLCANCNWIKRHINNEKGVYHKDYSKIPKRSWQAHLS